MDKLVKLFEKEDYLKEQLFIADGYSEENFVREELAELRGEILNQRIGG